MKLQKLKVDALNRFIRVKGIPVRTPFETILRTEQEVSFMKSLLHSQGIDDYSIIPIEEEKKEPTVLVKTTAEKKSAPKSQPKKKAATILEKIVDSE